jgi:hypothetical protein
MKNSQLIDNRILIVLGLVIVGLSLALVLGTIPALPSLTLKKLEDAKITEILWGALFITLIIERSLEVFISAWRDPGKLAIERLKAKQDLVNEKQKKIEDLETKINNGEIVDPEQLERKKQQIIKIEQELEKLNADIAQIEQTSGKSIEHYKTSTRSFALYGGFLMGFLSGLVGIRILEQIVEILPAITPQQLRAFRGLDILLTALAISGGSQIFHLLVSVLTDFSKQTRAQINTPQQNP